jgi:hypothetical protein
MAEIILRPADTTDIPAIAALRASDWETEAYWTDRITNYLQGKQPLKRPSLNVLFSSPYLGLL